MTDVPKNPDPSAQDPQGGNPAAGNQDPNNPGNGNPNPTNQGTVPLAALHEERERRQALAAETQALKEELEALRSMVTQAPPSVHQQYGNVYPQQPNQAQQQLDQLWENDLRKAVQAELAMGLQWYDQVNSQLDVQEAQVAAKHPDFVKYKSEVKRYIRSMPPEQRSRPGVMELAYFACRGQNVDNILKTREQEILEKIRKGEAVQGFDYKGNSNPPTVKKTQMTDEMKKVAAQMGISEEEYLKHVK